MLLPISCSTVVLNKPVNTTAKDYVIFLLLSGSITMSCGGEQFKLGAQDVAMVSPGTNLSAHAEEDNILIRVEIGGAFLAETYQTSDFTVHCNSALYPGDYSALVRQVVALAHGMLADGGNTWSPGMCACAFRLLDIIWRDHCSALTPDAYGEDAASRQDESARAGQIRRYLQIHYQEPLTLTALADHVHLTPQYFSKFFKKQFGVGFLKYLTQLRLSNACIDLSETNRSVTKVAMDNGFSNLSSFNKTFLEKYGMSPKEYRSKLAPGAKQSPFKVLTKQESAPYLNLPRLEPMTEEPVQLLPDNAAVSVDVAQCTLTPYTKGWEEIINLGSAENCFLHGMQEQLKGITKQVRFKYARISRVFSEELLFLSDEGELVGLNAFTKIVEQLSHANLIPFFDMGEPDAHRAAKKKKGGYSDQQWRQLLEQLLRHCVNTWGEDTVEQWRFELGQLEPEAGWAPYGPKWAERYTRRMGLTLEVIHRYAPRAQVGGPGLNLDTAGLAGLEPLFREMARQGAVPDFISAYLYPTYIAHEDGGAGGQGGQKIACIVYPCDSSAAGRIQQARALVENTFGVSLPLYITEYGSSCTRRSYINDTIYTAAFIAKTVVETFGLADALGYCNLSDIPDGDSKYNGPLFGGRGMLTRENMRKSAFYSYWLLGKVGESLVTKGENYFVCSRRPDCYELLVYNFKGLNKSFCLDYFRRTEPPFPGDAVLEDTRSMNFSMELRGLRPGKYRIKYYFLDREHGDLEKAANDLFSHTEMDIRQEDWEYLANVCIPEQLLKMVNVQNGTLPLEVLLSPNEVCLISVIFHSS